MTALEMWFAVLGRTNRSIYLRGAWGSSTVFDLGLRGYAVANLATRLGTMQRIWGGNSPSWTT